MFGKKQQITTTEDKKLSAEDVAHIMLTTAQEIPGKKYEIIDVIGTSKAYVLPAGFTKGVLLDLRLQAGRIEADAVIAVQIVQDHTITGSGGNAFGFGTAVKFID